MGWKPDQLPDLTGRKVIVTGSNGGIGYFAALELARHGAEVTLACRDADKANAAADRIRAEIAEARVSVAELDLSRLDSVRAFSDGWFDPLDLLINNAGVMAPLRRRETVDGFELQMGTNHLGHFALTGLLLPSLLAAATPHVVTIASLAHFSARLDMDDLQSVADYQPQRSYGNSKLANILFAAELQRRATAAGTSLVSTAAHPGLSSTGLTSNPDGMGGNRILGGVVTTLYRVVSQSAAAGAIPTLYAAVEAEPGSYTGPQSLRESRGAPGPARESEAAQDPALARELWELSTDLTGVTYDWGRSA
ncbi:MAG: Short-chain dehydrogenase/reductase [Pseudonocardiales bacterium]|nr:Short-chain dehydrogenase/reductase [Pseudonocardiales bacterium]